MSFIDFNIIDRITAIRNELQQNTFDEYRILIGIRNILLDIDEMEINNVRRYLLHYYNSNRVQNINEDVINYITSQNPNHQTGALHVENLLNTFLNNVNNNFDVNLPENIDSESQESLSISDSESINDDETLQNNNPINENTFFNMHPVFNSMNNFEYNINYNSLHNINQGQFLFPNPSIANISENANQQFENFATSIMNILSSNNNSVNNNFYGGINEDVPLVLKDSSLSNLKIDKYKNLSEHLKTKNKKCVIKLDDFSDEDDVRILPCDHVFCKEGIDDWLLNSSYKCPICRKSAGEYFAKVN